MAPVSQELEPPKIPGRFRYRGVIVGPAGLWSEIDLPQGWRLVAVELGGSNGGRAA